MTSTVRVPVESDIPWMLDELYKMDAELRLRLIPDDRGEATETLRPLLDAVAFISESEGVRTGFILGTVAPSLWNPSIKQLVELIWWITPEYRHTRAALLLMEAYVEAGKRLGVNQVQLVISDHANIKPTALTKRGFVHHETTFLRRREREGVTHCQ